MTEQTITRMKQAVYGVSDSTARRVLYDVLDYIEGLRLRIVMLEKELETKDASSPAGSSEPVDAVGLPFDSEKGKAG